MTRCAIYARYSSKLQRPTSIEDQIRNCRRAAEEKGWVVLDEYIRFDSELTGRTVVGRRGFLELVEFAKQRPLPFDCLLIDDTSRHARNLGDSIKELDLLTFYGVFVYFVSDNLDSRDGDNFRLVHLIKSYGDERHSKDLAKKIHRGQEGQILKGYTAGGSCYGYRNKYHRDPNQKGEHGENKVIAAEPEIVPEEAAVIERVMELRAAGLSFADIAKNLNAEGVPAPKRKYKGRVQDYWVASSIKEITKNELYHGVRIWNRTQKLLHPTEGTKVKRTRPQAEWVRVEVPSLRIVSEELWQRVQEVNRLMKDKIYGRRQGGFNRTAASRGYIFSGPMHCGICGGKFSIIIGGKRARYGCRNYRFRQACTNKVTILRTRLEHQLISAISKNLTDPRLEQQRFEDFKNGYSAFLSAQLAKTENRLAEIERLSVAKPATTLPQFTDEQIRTFLQQECQDFCDVLKSDPETARREIQKRIKKLVLTPKQTPDGAALEVSGDIELLRMGGVLDESPLEGTTQHYILPQITISLVLDPGAPLAA